MEKVGENAGVAGRRVKAVDRERVEKSSKRLECNFMTKLWSLGEGGGADGLRWVLLGWWSGGRRSGAELVTAFEEEAMQTLPTAGLSFSDPFRFLRKMYHSI